MQSENGGGIVEPVNCSIKSCLIPRRAGEASSTESGGTVRLFGRVETIGSVWAYAKNQREKAMRGGIQLGGSRDDGFPGIDPIARPPGGARLAGG